MRPGDVYARHTNRRDSTVLELRGLPGAMCGGDSTMPVVRLSERKLLSVAVPRSVTRTQRRRDDHLWEQIQCSAARTTRSAGTAAATWATTAAKADAANSAPAAAEEGCWARGAGHLDAAG